MDVGEADRFCVFLTRQRGRLAARAKGVRKPMSRMGGSLLPFSHVRIELVETDHSMIVTSATLIGTSLSDFKEFDTFTRLQRGVELVLRLTEDEEPLPKVFDLMVTFLHACAVPGCDPVPAFSACLLHVLGLLPADDHDPSFARLPEGAKAFIHACTEEATLEILCTPVPESHAVAAFLDRALEDHLRSPLKADSSLQRRTW